MATVEACDEEREYVGTAVTQELPQFLPPRLSESQTSVISLGGGGGGGERHSNFFNSTKTLGHSARCHFSPFRMPLDILLTESAQQLDRARSMSRYINSVLAKALRQ